MPCEKLQCFHGNNEDCPTYENPAARRPIAFGLEERSNANVDYRYKYASANGSRNVALEQHWFSGNIHDRGCAKVMFDIS